MRIGRLFASALVALTVLFGISSCRHKGAAGEEGTEPWGFLDGGVPVVKDADGGEHLLGDCHPTVGAPGNSLFVGQHCTPRGGECGKNPGGTANACAIDLDSRGGGYCIRVFCGRNSECGEGACCYGEPGSWAKACIPLGCVADAGICPE